MSGDIWRLRALLEQFIMRYANLLAAARATLRAEEEGEDDPLYYLRDELRCAEQLPDRFRSDKR